MNDAAKRGFILLGALGALASFAMAGPGAPGKPLPTAPAGADPVSAPAPRLGEEISGIVRGATLQRDLDSGRVRRVRGKVAVPGAGFPRDAAEGFLRGHASLLNLSRTLAELRLTRDVQSLTARHFTFQQQYAGLPVIGGLLTVRVDPDLAVSLVNLDLVPIAGGSVAVPGDSRAAVQAAVAAVGAPSGPKAAPRAEASVLVTAGTPASVWRITFDTRSPGAAWEVRVDIRTNRVLSVRNIARYVNGTGQVFSPNPVQTTGNENLADNADADDATLTAQVRTVTLQHLDGSGMLQGLYATTAPTALQTRANEPLLKFNYTRNDNRFEEVMCYHWVTAAQVYIQSLGFRNINNRAVGSDVNGTTQDNSFYSLATKEMTFGDGGVDDAEDMDVILHELGHAIHDNQVPGWGNSAESGAMGEGFGDYWAGSYSATLTGPRSPAWDVFVAKWDAVSYNPASGGNPAFLRRLDSPKRYPVDIVGEVHDDGEIWSACLWQIRGIAGRLRADTMILESHFSVTPDGTFGDGARAILDANRVIYDGANQLAIRQVFVDRGILPAPSTTLFEIAGKVLRNGLPVAGVAVTAGALSTSTAANGTYVILDAAAGTYSVTPSKSGEIFSPPNRVVTVGPSQYGVSFTTLTPDAFEPDDTAGEAKLIAAGQTQTRSIHAAGNVDWVRFTMDSPGDVSLETSGSTGDTEMFLFGPNSSTIQIAYDDDSGPGLFSRIIRTGVAKGTYYVRVQEKGNDDRIGSYALRLLVARGDIYEPDDTAAAAKGIVPAELQKRSIHQVANLDWVKFTILATSDVIIETAGTTGDTELFLFGPSLSTTAAGYDDDSGIDLFSRIQKSALPRGTYWIKLQEFGNNATIPFYSLRLTVRAPQGDAFEPDDSAAAAKVIAAGQTQNRTIHLAGDQDWAKFTLAETRNVVIETAGASGDSELFLYGPNLSTTFVAYDDSSGVGEFSRIARPLTKGTYWIRVREYGNNGTIAAYTLKLTAQ